MIGLSKISALLQHPAMTIADIPSNNCTSPLASPLLHKLHVSSAIGYLVRACFVLPVLFQSFHAFEDDSAVYEPLTAPKLRSFKIVAKSGGNVSHNIDACCHIFITTFWHTMETTLEVTSVGNISIIKHQQELDCNRCLIMTERSSKKGKLALVPSVTFDKHIGKGLVLEQNDQDTLTAWEGKLRKFLRVVSYPVTIVTKHQGSTCATLHISPTRLYLSRGFPPKFGYLGWWDIALHAKNLTLLDNRIQLDVVYDGADKLTMTTEDASDIFATIKGCYSKLNPVEEPEVNLDSIVPSSRRRLGSMPTSIRNDMSLGSFSMRTSIS